MLRADGAERELLWYQGAVRRLALGMAVTEELERRALAGEAADLEGDAAEACEVAQIADNMFVPPAVADWIDRHRPRSRPRGADEGRIKTLSAFAAARRRARRTSPVIRQ